MKSNADTELVARPEPRLQELTESIEHLQLIVETMSDGLITIDEGGSIISMNSMAGKISGYDPAQCAGISAIRLLGDVIGKRAGFVNAAESSLTTSDGSILPIELSIRVAITQRGRLFIATIKDLSDFKNTQKKLLQQAHIIERSQSFVFVMDSQHMLEWCNPRFLELTGYGLEEVVGLNPMDLLFGQGPVNEQREKIRGALAAGKPFNEEVLLFGRNGHPFWAQIDAHPIFGDGGGVEKFVGLGYETTDRRFAAQMQVDFISMVSHELRTPLTVISGVFEALRDTPNEQSEPVAEMLFDMGQRNCQHLTGLIEDLLDINKMESGTMSYTAQSIDVEKIARSAICDVQAIADEAEVRLSLPRSDGPALVHADPKRVKQILINLLSNAIKFSSADSNVVLSIERLPEATRISVADQGRGIPESFRPMLFRKFSREASVEAEGTDGFGLGLSICKQLVEQMGGRIDFESTEGKGTRFFFELPSVSASKVLESLHSELVNQSG